MTAEPEVPPAARRANVKAGILKRVATYGIIVIVTALLLFGTAGRRDWLWAWVYMGIWFASMAIIGPITIRTTPEAVAERGEFRVKKTWDKVIVAVCLLALFVALPLVAGLDERFGWTGGLALGWHVLGGVLLVAGMALYAWGMLANVYFSMVVRLQEDRGQAVCTTGPYRIVRHPGYVGLIVQALGLPLLLGSWWALLPGLAASLAPIVRTSLEDRMLQAELPGYQDYAQIVRHRLLPGVW
jgi:protein-S-isoprenylcysteine O-methyltransferase Ste14